MLTLYAEWHYIGKMGELKTYSSLIVAYITLPPPNISYFFKKIPPQREIQDKYAIGKGENAKVNIINSLL